VVDGTSRPGRGASPHDLPVDHSRDVISIPNVITVLRLALIPFFYWFLVFAPTVDGRNDVAFSLFFLCAGTDWLDGFIARRTGAVTAIGKVIDPLVDRLLIAAAVVGLYLVGRMSLAIVLVLIGRDVYLLYGAWVLERHGRRVAVTVLGKATTAVLLAGFGSLIWNFPLVTLPAEASLTLLGHAYVIGGTKVLGIYLVYVGVVMSLTAAFRYTVLARRAYREAVAEERERPAAPHADAAPQPETVSKPAHEGSRT
jgi:cardiolipin synthase (CMP-forming)